MAKQEYILDPQSLPYLEQLSGQGKGRVFELHGDSLSIGRSEENDICLPSESVSRHHAVLERISNGTIWIKDQGSKNGIIVNNQRYEMVQLQSGDVVQVGTFHFRFLIEGSEVPASTELVAEDQEAKALPLMSSGKRLGPPNRRPLLYGGLILVLGAVYYLNNGDGEKKESSAKEATGKDKDLTITELAPLDGKDPRAAGVKDPADLAAELNNLDADEQKKIEREAELYFRRGQREYWNQNYQRSIEAFSTALTIYRGHRLAAFYLSKAKQEAELAAKKNMEIGIKYYQTLQYARAIYHFREAIALMAHRPQEKIVSDCEKYIAVSQKKLSMSEMYP